MFDVRNSYYKFFRGVPKQLLKVNYLVILHFDTLAAEKLFHYLKTAKMMLAREMPVPVNHTVGRNIPSTCV